MKMPNDGLFNEKQGIGGLTGIGTQKTLHMIFVVDNSGSMRNENRMEAVNQAFCLMIPKLQELQTSVSSDFTIMISIMAFNEDPEWITTPTEIGYYIHSDIPASQYVTYFSRAFQELNHKLSRSQFMNQKGKMAQPYIMLMTDGAPSAEDNYEPQITKLKENGWFEGAQKYAVLIGEDTIHDPVARQAVSSFVDGNEESIINAADATDIVKNVSAKTMHIVEQMTQRKGPTPGDEINKNGSSKDPQPSPGPWPGGEPNPGVWPNPGEIPTPGPVPEPGASNQNPFPGFESMDKWPVFPQDTTPQSAPDSETPDPDDKFNPNLSF